MTSAPSEDNRGVILIALLWILTILAVIALSFARETFVEVATARNHKDQAGAYYIARAGITTAVYQLYLKTMTMRPQSDLLSQPVDPVDLGKITGQFGGGEYEVDIQDESGKFNLNFAREDELRSLLAVIGIEKPDADTIVDSLMDWRDPDRNPRPNGAEDDYYQSLQPPHVARNGNGSMSAVEELLLVRGVTPEYFYGRREKSPDGGIIERYGLSRYLTVFSMGGDRINVNSAPLPVLLAISDMPPAAAQMIYERRQVRPFENPLDINKEVAPNLSPTALGRLSMQRTGIYTLTASAHRDNSLVKRVIRTVVRMDPSELNKYRIIYWNENVPIW